MSIINIQGLSNQLGGTWVHRELDLNVEQGEILAIVGGSGSGKTTLLRSMLMLLKPKSGKIELFGVDVNNFSEEQTRKTQQRWGVLFQHGALFSSLTVLENILFPLKEFTDMDRELQIEMAMLKLGLVGLSADVASKYPAQLSGGMKKRVALARAIALDPEILFLDEPTAGLDPASASALDALIVHLRYTLGLTIVMVTHDLDTLWNVPDRVAFLGNKKVLAVMPIKELMQHDDPQIKAFFAGKRGEKFLTLEMK